MDKPLAAFYALVFILIWVFDALFGPVRAASVVPGGMTPNDLAWLAEATGTTVSGSLDALLSKPVNGTLTTAKGAKIPLPANWSAAIPRATAAQAAGKLLARATPIGLAGLALYQLLHNDVGLNSDGTVAGYVFNVPTYTCSGHTVPTLAASGTPSSTCSQLVGWLNSRDSICYPANGASTTMTSVSGASCVTHTTYTNGNPASNWTYSMTAGSPATPTEPELGTAIQNSPAPTADIAQDVIKDAKTANIDFGGLGFLTPIQPTTITASPVVAPEETIATEIIPNADGTTSTRTTKVQTTATPKVTGTTVGDQALEWETSDKQTRTTTNNATGVTTTETTTTSYGTSTTQQQPDYGKFAGTGPGDGYADGLSFINSKLCAGNCAAAFSCATGNCTVAERVNSLKTKYVVSPSASGTCPPMHFDFGAYMGLGSLDITEHCTLLESMRPTLNIVLTLVIALSFIAIVLSA